MAEKLTFEEILADPENLVCPCHHDGKHGDIPACEHRTICHECVIVHRMQDIPPVCQGQFANYEFTLPDMKVRYGPDGQEKWLADPENKKCICTYEFDGVPCAYRGKCKECIAIHRYFKGFSACVPDFPGKGELRHDFKPE